jgi:hypothetical protein
MARIENHKYSIEEAFRECFYIVPDYQREYVWTDKEVHQLLEDIGEQIDAGTTREYFIGTVLVSPTDQKNHYEVIDGQQRLTTFFLLLCALKHLFQGEPQRQMISGLISTSYVDSDGEVRTNLKLEPRYESAGEVMAKLVELDADPQTVRAGIQASGIASFGSLENLVNAYSTLYRYLKDNYDDAPKLKKYWGYLANNVVFIQISTDVSSALKIFETINERGVGLNPMDLLKNLLFTQVKQAQFTQLKDEWKKITKPLEKEKEKPLRFLRYFLMANYTIKNERGDAVVREDEIYDWFIAKDNAALCDYAGKPFEFVRKVIRNVEHYLAFANGLGNDGKPAWRWTASSGWPVARSACITFCCWRRPISPSRYSTISWRSWRASSSTTSSPRPRPRIWSAASPNGPTSCARLRRRRSGEAEGSAQRYSSPIVSRRTWRASRRNWPMPSNASPCTRCSSTGRATCWRG